MKFLFKRKEINCKRFESCEREVWSLDWLGSGELMNINIGRRMGFVSFKKVYILTLHS
jgi:hypothetical protein